MRMSPTKENVANALNEIRKAGDNIILSDDQVMSNYVYFITVENENISSGNYRPTSDNQLKDDLCAVAFSAGAYNYLSQSGRSTPPQNILEQIYRGFQYNPQISQPTPTPTPIPTPTPGLNKSTKNYTPFYIFGGIIAFLLIVVLYYRFKSN